MWNNIIRTMHGSANLTRDGIWAPQPPYMPTVRKEFAKLPRPGYVGQNWRPHGWVLVGTNPSSTEGRDPSVFSKGDAVHSRILRQFALTPNETTFTDLMNYEKQDMLKWALDWAISGTLERIGAGLDEVAILNAIPFSTKEAPKKTSPAWKNATIQHFSPLLHALEASGLIWLGKAAAVGAGPHMNLPFGTKTAVVSRQRDLEMSLRFADLTRLLHTN